MQPLGKGSPRIASPERKLSARTICLNLDDNAFSKGAERRVSSVERRCRMSGRAGIARSLAGAWTSYEALLVRRPYQTQAATSALLW